MLLIPPPGIIENFQSQASELKYFVEDKPKYIDITLFIILFAVSLIGVCDTRI